jgi:two-component system, LytTR family, sensor kinase
VDRSSRNNWLLIFACWTALVVLFTSHAYLYSTVSGQRINLKPIFLWAISEWYTWAALTPLVVWWARKFPIDSVNAFRAAGWNIVGAAAFSVVHVFLQSFLRSLGIGGDSPIRSFSQILSRSLPDEFHASFATCAVILCASHAVEYYRRYSDRKVQASQLETALARAHIAALRMQINPHFLFNALNSVSALIDEDPKGASKMLARLGDFLRLTLKNNGSEMSSLEQELQFLESYLQIEQVRFGDRLIVDIDVEPAALGAAVPSLILQPIVENAFRHAISKVESGRLDIQGRRDSDQLELKVTDNGPGRRGEGADGLGLANTRARLQTQYGDDQSLLLENAAGGGLVVTIRIPFISANAKWN